jgi:hypothetical protein
LDASGESLVGQISRQSPIQVVPEGSFCRAAVRMYLGAGMVSKQCQTEVLSVKVKLSAVSELSQKLSDGLLGRSGTLASILEFYLNGEGMISDAFGCDTCLQAVDVKTRVPLILAFWVRRYCDVYQWQGCSEAASQLRNPPYPRLGSDIERGRKSQTCPGDWD